MDDVTVESTLNFFKTRSNVKGQSTYEKLQALYLRWTKVIDDCEKSNDNSIYRLTFREAHRAPLELIVSLLKDLNPDSESQVRMATNTLRVSIFALLKKSKAAGELDAYGFIYSELESI